jgi:hypothetical protein
MRKVIFVGDTSSPKNLDKNVAFLGTKSYEVLKEWIAILQIEEYALVNSDHFSFNMFVAGHGNGQVFICLGNIAKKALKDWGYHEDDFFSLPHPSPKNRKLNDKKFIKQELEKCKKWLSE